MDICAERECRNADGSSASHCTLKERIIREANPFDHGLEAGGRAARAPARKQLLSR